MSKSVLITLVLILLTSSIYAKKPTLGILQFEIKTPKVEKISKHMYSYLKDEVTRLVSDKYRIIPAPKMDLEELYMMFACDSPNEACMVSIAKMMKVKFIVYGTVSFQRGKYELILRLLDVKTKKLKKGRLLGNLSSKKAMNENIDKALRAMFEIKEKQIETRLLSVTTNGVVSDVYLDGKKIGVTPITLTNKTLKPGKYGILIKKEGYEPIKKEIFLSENKIETLDLKLSPIVIPALKKDNKKIVANNKSNKVKSNLVKKDETLDLTKDSNSNQKPKEWYQEWWLWGVTGAVITATVVTVILLNGDEPSNSSSHNVVITF